MIGLFIALIVVGVILTGAGIVIGGIALAEGEFAVTLASALGIGIGVVLFVLGLVQVHAIERTECEQAGYEWITGQCYGSNVRVIEGAK